MNIPTEHLGPALAAYTVLVFCLGQLFGWESCKKSEERKQ